MIRLCILLCAVAVTTAAVAAPPSRSGDGPRGQTPLPTTIEDYMQPGSQPSPTDYDYIIVSSWNCINCHEFDNDLNDDEVVPPYDNWVTSLMAQSMRDPVFHAAFAIANQDADDVGEFCLRCHAPGGWIQSRSEPADGSALIEDDFDGVNCNFCHRMVDPIWDAANPVEDDDILQQLVDDGVLPEQPGNGRYIVDPLDVRRGPREDLYNMHGVPILISPFHRESEMCGTCHELSNPAFSLQSDGTWAPNAYDAAHPTQNMYEMIPEQRTFGEWKQSQFASGGVQFNDGRFGGDHPTGNMQSCQDCHMPRRYGATCVFVGQPDVQPHKDVAGHEFIGVSTWVLRAVNALYEPSETGLSEEALNLAEARTQDFLQAASDLDLWQDGGDLVARVTNWTGHKLPTGYPEGRRIWLSAQFLDADGTLLAERGHYDWATAELTTADTKVYEMQLGISDSLSKKTGVPAGPSMHLVLFDQIYLDNRIPPVGFTNDGFTEINAQPIGYAYSDGQHWDDTTYAIPIDAVQAVVTVYHQTTSKEYIEFLRDANVTNDSGQIAYDQWVAQGMSAPVVMDSAFLDLEPVEPIPGDVDGDGDVDVVDLLAIIAAWGPCPGCPADVNGDGLVNVTDLLITIANWG